MDLGSESEYEDGDFDFRDVLDFDGFCFVDGKGWGMIKICEDEVFDDFGV